MNPFVLVCRRCGAQHELPGETRLHALDDSRAPWLVCPPCKSAEFGVRMRTPHVKTEPAK